MSADLALLRLVEAAAVRGWPALESTAANGWLWRFTSGGSIRANTVATLAYHGTDLDNAIEDCERLYRAKGANTIFSVSDVSEPAGLDAALAQRGYVRGDDHVTMAKRVDPDVTLPASVSVGVQPTTGWMEAYLSGLSANRREAAPGLIAGLPKSAVFISDDTNRHATSSGLTVIDGDVASVQCMATVAEARRNGGALRVLEGIEAIAAQNKAHHLYLQTGGDNSAARALYSRYGFRVIGHYHTRTKALQV